MDLEQRPKKIIFNAFLRYNSFYFFMHFLAARAALYLPCWLTDSLTDWLFWIQSPLDQTYLTFLPDPPELPTHLTFSPIYPTHPPDLPISLIHPDNLPKPTDNLPEPTDNLHEPTDNLHEHTDNLNEPRDNLHITESTDITILTKFHNIYQIKISQLWSHFTIVIKFHNFDQIFHNLKKIQL